MHEKDFLDLQRRVSALEYENSLLRQNVEQRLLRLEQVMLSSLRRRKEKQPQR